MLALVIAVINDGQLPLCHRLDTKKEETAERASCVNVQMTRFKDLYCVCVCVFCQVVFDQVHYKCTGWI